VTGDVVGDIEVRGPPEALSGHLRVASTRLGAFGVAGESLVVNLHADAGVVRTLKIDAETVAAARIEAAEVSLLGGGPLDALRVDLRWLLDDREGHVPFVLALGAAVDLEVDAAARLAAPFDDWDADRDVAVSMGAGRLSVSAHCWQRVGGTARVCTDALEIRDDFAEISGRLVDVRAAAVAALIAGLPDMDGVLNAEWQLGRDDQWRGDAKAAIDEWVLLVDGDAAGEALPRLEAELHLEHDNADIRFRGGTPSDVLVEGEGEIVGVSQDAHVAGEVRLNLESLGWVAAIDPRVQDVAGQMTGRALISGTLATPEIRAEVRVRDGQLAMVNPRVSLHDVTAQVVMDEISQVDVEAAGSAGEGTFSLSGQVLEPFASRSLVFDMNTQALTIETPELRATADSNLTLTYEPQVLSVRGDVGVPYARLNVVELPESAVARSRDVVVLDRPLPRQRNEFRPDIELTLGEDVRFEAFGLKGRLRGHLNLHQSSSGALALTGQLDVYRGSFDAYGMSLEVKSGRLVFAGPPDNPFVDARAVRVIDNPDGRVEVGLHLTGPARSLKTTLFSTPTMAERDILSYLVFGQPMSANSSAEDEQLGTTATALGMVPAGLLLVGLRDALGLDELTATGESQDDMTLIAGTRLTEDIFVRYTYQTVTGMSALLIRLALTDRWAVEATAAQAPGLDLIYRVGR
jgi:translocation and assembly module TamB